MTGLSIFSSFQPLASAALTSAHHGRGERHLRARSARTPQRISGPASSPEEHPDGQVHQRFKLGGVWRGAPVPSAEEQWEAEEGAEHKDGGHDDGFERLPKVSELSPPPHTQREI